MKQTFEPMMEFPEDHRTWRAGDPRWDVILNDSARKSGIWMRTLEQGRVVHYHHGFGAWVRCEVVDHPLRRPGSVGHDASIPSLVPLAMVGEQWPRDWPATRDHWSEKIQKGESFQPSASFVYESPYWTEDGPDPREMEIWTA
jgi:hypothetical protein